jgi:hypothetical protein
MVESYEIEVKTGDKPNTSREREPVPSYQGPATRNK